MADQNRKQSGGFNPIGLCLGVSVGLCFGTAMDAARQNRPSREDSEQPEGEEKPE